jgi:putative transposase
MTAANRKLRLRRLDRVFVRSPTYFITACTANRRSLLATAAVHETLLRFGQEGSRYVAWIGAYVIMPDHVHLFVATDDEKITLSAWMKSLKNTISKVLRSTGVAPPHWQKTFFDHLLRSGESYSQKWAYVRENPVRARLVGRPEDWPYMGQIFALEYRTG